MAGKEDVCADIVASQRSFFVQISDLIHLVVKDALVPVFPVSTPLDDVGRSNVDPRLESSWTNDTSLLRRDCLVGLLFGSGSYRSAKSNSSSQILEPKSCLNGGKRGGAGK